MSTVKVSVIIPTYKRSEDIARAVDSVLAQTIDSFEVIVCDDNGIGTEDGEKTAQVMAAYADDPRVVYCRHEINKNGAAARNTGIAVARGEYIAFLDDDDTYRPERLQRMYDKMESLDETWGACYTGYVKHKANGEDQYSGETNEGDLYVQALMRALYIGTGSNLFFSRAAVNNVGMFDVSFRRNQDLEYLARVLKEYKMAYVDEVLMDAYYDIRTTHLTFEEHWKREQMFRESFAHHLKALPLKQKREVQIMYELDWARLCIAFKKYGAAVKTLLKARIPLKVFWQYFLYICDRYKTKKSYGFVVKL